MFEDILEFKGRWRSYQQKILDNFDAYGQDRKYHIVAAPGSGKTTLGIELIRRINQPVLILAPSITIKEQWYRRIYEAFLVNQNECEKYLSKNIKEPKIITITTYQALHSAMNHYYGELIETNDEFKNVEEVDYRDFDVIEKFKTCHLGTLCLDECHHLRSEWWKALEQFKKAFDQLYTVALTATPPYDDNINMWTKYLEMCGEIDEEIMVPELVKDGVLCPHQDYVYFNYPTKHEKQMIDIFEENGQELLEQLVNDRTFAMAIESHHFFHDIVSEDEVLENPAYLSAMLIFLNTAGMNYPVKYQKLLGFKKLEELTLKWLEILLQGFLYDDVASYHVNEKYREELIKELKSKGLIEKKKVTLQVNQAIEKILVNSMGKCESIKEIVFHEYENMHSDLRLLILTDYIRKEYQRALGDESKDVNNLGVLPFFEQLRRETKQRNSNLRLGVLCGTMIIIPIEACHALEEIVQDKNKIIFNQVGRLDDYIRVDIVGDHHFITEAISELFTRGYIHVLIGTKSLLGEGWDAPCINSLILASFVGSYMLSNQMRGRAIRVFKDNPNKTSNIWHLVCVKPRDNTGYDYGNSEDYLMLSRRMEHFLGLHYQQDTIENGIGRLSAIRMPFNQANIKKTNKEMLKLANQRNDLKERWQKSLAVYDKIEIVDETEVQDKYITVVMFNDALRILIIIAAVGILGAVACLPLLDMHAYSYLLIVIYVSVFALVLILQSKKVYTLANPLGRLQIFGQGILTALTKTNQLDSINNRVETDSMMASHAIYLRGGTGHDKALFAKCVFEFFEVIDNQRYLLYNRKRKGKLDAYFVVPECFAKRKEDALLFSQYMKPFIGKYEVIYTRNEAGRKILLEARIKALANREERCFTRKKAKGALE